MTDRIDNSLPAIEQLPYHAAVPRSFIDMLNERIRQINAMSLLVLPIHGVQEGHGITVAVDGPGQLTISADEPQSSDNNTPGSTGTGEPVTQQVLTGISISGNSIVVNTAQIVGNFAVISTESITLDGEDCAAP